MVCCCCSGLALTGVVAGLLVWLFRRPIRPAITGVYRQPGRFYPLKFALAYVVLVIRKSISADRWRCLHFSQWRNSRTKSFTSDMSRKMAGYGIKSKAYVNQMEKPQPLSDDPKAIDAVYISGFNGRGEYIVTATARCPNQLINGFWFLRIPEIGLLKAPKLPESTIKADGEMVFAAEGLKIEPVEPMKKWSVSYDGKMRFEKEPERLVDVKMKLEFISALPYFDFDTDIPPAAMARALAREPWSREYFDRLKEAHQTHYEQMGDLRGKVTVEGFGEYDIEMNGYRDHSYGHKREWKYMHRYGLHSVALEDGTMFTVGIVSQPVNLSTLEMGYLYTPWGELHGVEWCDLPLHSHGEGGQPPTDYAFSFGAGGETYLVQVNVVDLSHLNMGLEWEARFVERFCTFTVNGRRGWGISEWEYRKHEGRTTPTDQEQ